MSFVTWVLNAGGDWDTAANWSAGALPTSDDQVTISTTTIQTITHSTGDDFVGSLAVGNDIFEMEGGSLDVVSNAAMASGFKMTGGSLGVAAAMSINSGATTITGGTLSVGTTLKIVGTLFQNNGTISAKSATVTGTAQLLGGALGSGTVFQASGVITLGNYDFQGSSELKNEQTLNQTGSITLGDSSGVNATILNQTGATYNIANSVNIASGAATAQFLNSGKLVALAGTGTSAIDVQASSTGTISIGQQSTLDFAGALTNLGGTITGAGTLGLVGGVTTLAAGATINVAMVTLSGNGTTLALGGNETLSGGFAEADDSVLQLNGHTLTLAGTAQFQGSPGISGGGALATAGTTNLSAGLVIGGGVTWNNSGTVIDTSSFQIGDGSGTTATLTNAASGVFNLAGDISIGIGVGSDGIVNAGLLEMTAGAGVSHIYTAVSNSGTITAAGGTLEIDGALSNSKSVTTSGGNINIIGNVSNSGTINANDDNITIDGNIINKGAITATNGGIVNVYGNTNNNGSFTAGKGAYIILDGGTFSGGSVKGAGTIVFAGAAATATFTTGYAVGATSIVGGTATFNGAATTSTLSQTGGTLNGTGTLTVTGAASFGSGGSTAIYELQAGTGTMLLEGATTIANYAFGTYGLFLDGGRILENTGTVSWTNGVIELGYNPYGGTVGGGTILNASGGTFDIQSADDVLVNGSGVNSFTNAGTLEQTLTTGTSTIGVALTNTGVVSVLSGTLNLTDGGTSSSKGAFTVAQGATLAFSGSTFTFSGGSIGGAGTIAFVGGNATFTTGYAAGATSIASGTATFNSPATTSTLSQTGGTLNGTGTLTVTGAATFGSGGGTPIYEFQAGTGTTLLEGATTIANYALGTYGLILDGGRVLENAGTVNWTNGVIELGYNPYGGTVGGGAILNASGGTFDIQSADDVLVNGSGANSFTNIGTLEQTVTTGTSTIGVALTNTGAVSVQSGTLDLSDGGTSSSKGAFTVAQGATLAFSGSTFTFSGGSIGGAGTIAFVGGNATFTTGYAAGATSIASGTATFNGGATTSTLSQTGSELSGVGTLTVTGAATFGSGNWSENTELQAGTGTTLLEGATTISNYPSTSYGLYLDGGRVLENTGTVNWTNGVIELGDDPYGGTIGGATILNASGGTFDIESSDDVLVNGSGVNSFTNVGTLEQTVTTGTSTFGVALTNSGTVSVLSGTLNLTDGLANSGTVSVQSGTLNLSDGGTSSSSGAFTVAQGATLAFSGGTFTFSGGSIGGAGTIAFVGGNATFTTGYAAGATSIASGTATFNSPATTSSLSQTGGTLNGTGTLTVTGAATFGSGGWSEKIEFQAGAGTTLFEGTTTIANYASGNGYGLFLDGGRVLENTGTVNWTNGVIELGNDPYGGTIGGATILNASVGTFDIESSDDVLVNGSGANSFINAGTLKQTVTTGTSTIGVALTNTGKVSVLSGTLDLADGGTSSSKGAFTVALGATLEFSSGTFIFTGGSVKGTGTVAFVGGAATFTTGYAAGVTSIVGGTATFNGAATTSKMSQTGGELSGTGTLTVTGAANFGSGVGTEIIEFEYGTGTTQLEGATTIANYVSTSYGLFLDGGRVLENTGTVSWTGGHIFLGDNPYGGTVGGATILNASGGTFDIESADDVLVNDSGANSFTNLGTLEQTITTGTSTIGVALTNTGAVSVQSGTLDLTDGGTSSSKGAFTVAQGATLAFSGSTFTFNGGSIGGAGTIAFVGGNATFTTGYAAGATSIASGTATFNGAATTSTLSQTGGTLNGTGTLTVTGAATFGSGGGTPIYELQAGTGTTLLEGVTTIANYVSTSYGLFLDGGRVLENTGTVNWTGGYIFLGDNPYGGTVGGATILNASGGTFDIESADDVLVNDSGANSFTNLGTLEQTITTGTSTIGVALINTGTVAVLSGTLAFTDGVANSGVMNVGAGETLSVNGGALTGSGTVNLQGAGSVVDIYGATTNAFDFATTSASTLWLDDYLDFGGTISNFAGSNAVDLANMFAGGVTLGWQQNTGSGVLTVTDNNGSTTETANLTFEGTYTLGEFSYVTGSGGGVKVGFV